MDLKTKKIIGGVAAVLLVVFFPIPGGSLYTRWKLSGIKKLDKNAKKPVLKNSTETK